MDATPDNRVTPEEIERACEEKMYRAGYISRRRIGTKPDGSPEYGYYVTDEQAARYGYLYETRRD